LKRGAYNLEQTPQIIPAQNFSPEEEAKIAEIANGINFSDQSQLVEFGASAQAKTAQFSDSVLQHVKTQELGGVGDSLSSLVTEIKSVEQKEDTGFFANLFGAGKNIVKKIEKMKANYDKAEVNVDKIVSVLNSHRRELLKDYAVLENLYENNLNYFRELNLFIAAGEKRLTEYREKDIVAQRELSERTNDDFEIHKLNDMLAAADRLEKNIHDLKISRTISIQTAAQSRLIQQNDMQLADKIQSSIVNAIPLWKNQMVIAMSLAKGKAALSAQQKVTDLTNEMLVKNSEMLRQGSVEVARESEKSIVAIETIQKTNENLISTINEVLEVHRKGREERANAEKELLNVENNLRLALQNRSHN
jgi:uncharacterized protein YaaN involved in tellurite resistance